MIKMDNVIQQGKERTHTHT